MRAQVISRSMSAASQSEDAKPPSIHQDGRASGDSCAFTHADEAGIRAGGAPIPAGRAYMSFRTQAVY